MRKIYFFALTFLVISEISLGQNYTWSGALSTDYQVAGNWSPSRTAPSISDTLSFNAVSQINVANVANQTIGAIQLASGTGSVIFSTNIPSNILTLDDTVPLIYKSAGKILAGNFLTIQLSSASSLTINSGVFGIAAGGGGKIRINGALTLAGGSLDFDVAGTGGATISGPTGSITYISGTFSSARAASLTWLAGSNYYHKADGLAASAIPVSTWHTGSTCNITGMNAGTVTPTGLTTINFSNFTWNCPLQNGSINLLPAGATITINGALFIQNTGSSSNELRVSVGKSTVKATSYLQTGGFVTLQGGLDTTNLTVAETFSQVAGTLNGVGGTSAGLALIDLKGSVNRNSGATWQSNGNSAQSQLIIQFSGTSLQTVNVSQGTWTPPAAGRCNIVNSNKDLINGVNLTGILRVYNTGNTTLPATLTMNGVFTGTGGVTYAGAGAGGTALIYSGSFFQTASDIEFPVLNGPPDLTVNNTLGVSFPANFSRNLPGRLTMIKGNLAIGSGDTLSLTNTNLANQLSYTAGFVTTGTLGRYFPTTGLPTVANTNSLFPFGSGANNRFLNVYFSAASLSGGAAGMIYVAHAPIVDATPISLADNNPTATTLNKRTNTSWNISTGAFNLGSGGRTISITAIGANVGSVNDFTYLRLTDAITPNFGTLIATTGSNAVPTVGKSGLTQAAINKTLYIGSDSHNPLIIITFTWTGLGGNTSWTTPANWTGGGVGYPSSSTEIAILSSTAGLQPTINNGTTIDIYQLNVSPGITLTMPGSSVINVFDTVRFSGTAVFAPTSTFGYASSTNVQNILNLPYGSLTVLGTAQKILPASVSVKGAYSISGVPPDIATNSNTFIYAGAGAQTIYPTNYYNLSITGNRGGGLITLGGFAQNVIDIKNVFDVSSLSNDSVYAGGNSINFSGNGLQTIPGFYYNNITNTGNGPRTLDPLGSTNPAHVIVTRTFDRGSGAYIIANSKINLYVSGTRNTAYGSASYYDLTISGNLQNFILENISGSTVHIAGTFNCTVTNFKPGSNSYTIDFNGTGDQTIAAFKGNEASNTPTFKYSNITIAGGNRNVTLGGNGTDTIAITGNLTPETNALGNTASPFSAGKGFIVGQSIVNFGSAGSSIPALKPVLAGGNNYNDVVVSSGTRIIGGDMTLAGNLTISGTDPDLPTTLTVGNGSSMSLLNVSGNLTIIGNAALPPGSGRVSNSLLNNNKLLKKAKAQ